MRGEVGYNHLNYIKSFKRIKSFVTDGVLIPGTVGINFDGAVQIFAQGKAAMFYMGNWAYPTIKSAVGDMKKITVTWVPHDPGMISQPTGGAAHCVTISKHTKQLDGAVAFVEYLARDDSAYLVAVRRGTPTSNIKGDEKAGKEIGDHIWVNNMSYYENMVVFYDWLWEPEITREFQAQVQSLLAGQITPEECGELIQKRFEELRREGRTYYWK
jgi:raffinose/stachyose/melibiose transport system substrate-binding protein